MKCSVMFISLVCLLFVASSAIAASDSDSDSDSDSGRCSLAGTWFGETDAGFVFLITFNPLDNSHRAFSIIADADANHPSGGGVFLEAVEFGTFHGEAKRTGPRSFEQMSLAYGRDDSFPLPWIATITASATWELSSGCDTAEVNFQAATFFPEQNPFVDEPFFCYPPDTGTYHRVPVIGSACAE